MIERVQEIGTPPSPSNVDPRQGQVASPSDSRHPELASTARPVSSQSPADKSHSEPDCEFFRPTTRAPMALLTIFDDGSQKHGQTIRIRADRTRVGRDSGDVTIPHDHSISSQHAEIVREVDRGRYRWFLADMGSSNGTFVRLSKSTFKHAQELVIGGRRYRYRQAIQAEESPEANDSDENARPKGTMGWKAVSPSDIEKVYPALVEVLPNGEEGQVLAFSSEEVTLGSDEERCSHILRSDPFVSQVHARIYRSSNRQWVIEDADSVNGIWLRITSLPLEARCEFQLGEQRFLFRPL